MKQEDRLNLFGDVLSLIKSTELLNFAKDVLINADDYFFTMPASTTGKYHPQFALGDGGLIRHTKAVTMNAYTIADSLDFDDYHKDMMVIAAIAHDIKKKGNGGSAYTTKDHPLCAYNYLMSLPHPGIEDYIIVEIASAVRAHMGRWGDFPPQTPFERALQAADLIASKKWFNLNFVEMPRGPIPSTTTLINESTPIAAPMPAEPSSPGDVTLWFGKHKGMSVKELCEKDIDYADWIINNFDNKELVGAIKAHLETLKK